MCSCKPHTVLGMLHVASHNHRGGKVFLRAKRRRQLPTDTPKVRVRTMSGAMYVKPDELVASKKFQEQLESATQLEKHVLKRLPPDGKPDPSPE